MTLRYKIRGKGINNKTKKPISFRIPQNFTLHGVEKLREHVDIHQLVCHAPIVDREGQIELIDLVDRSQLAHDFIEDQVKRNSEHQRVKADLIQRIQDCVLPGGLLDLFDSYAKVQEIADIIRFNKEFGVLSGQIKGFFKIFDRSDHKPD